MKRKEYEKEMRRPAGRAGGHAGVGQGHRRQGLHRVRGRGLGRQGRHDPADHRADEPAGVQAHRPAGPDEREKSQMYIQRYIAHFPSAGEVVIFDRSWYNRAGVEPVMGYCTPEQTERFLEHGARGREGDGRRRDHPDQVLPQRQPSTSRPGGSRAGSTTRARSGSSRPTDLKSYSRRYDYLPGPRRDVRRHRAPEWAPWYIVDNDDKKRGRLNIISPPAQPDPVRAAPAAGREDAEAAEPTTGTSSRRSLAAQHPDAVLDARRQAPRPTGLKEKDWR